MFLVKRMVVKGRSMLPTLEPGDRLVVVRARKVRPGMLIALRDPRQQDLLVIKRATTVTNGHVTVLGDNPSESTDSRSFGPVPLDNIIGRVIYRYYPSARAGRL